MRLHTPHTHKQTDEIQYLKLLPLCALVLFLLTACGGGGGGGGGGDTIFVPRSAPTADVLNTPDATGYANERTRFEASAEYDVDWVLLSDSSISGVDSHLRRINAAAAYARGATGAGEIIAIVDTGIRDTHREFSGVDKVIKVTQSGYSPTDEQKFHGTFVAALAVGNRDGGTGLNMHGVAFDARVHFSEIPLGTSDGIYRPFRLENHSDLDDRSLAGEFEQRITNARNVGAAIINQSFGLSGVISSYNRQELRSRFGHTAVALAQASTADADKTIIVWAAGNAGNLRFPNGDPAPFDSPEILSGLGAYFPALQSHVLAVVALDQDGSIASYSNRCGIAKSFCLAAPGSNLVSAFRRGDNDYVGPRSGTSFAAPLVSGSLALLRQYFRGQLGNTELVTRLLATANREGIYADSDIYGHGLVDLDAATAPVGPIMTGLPGDPDSRPFAGSGIGLSSGAFGASLQNALADIDVAGFDALGAPFFQSAVAWVTPPAQHRRDAGHKPQTLSLLTSSYKNARQNNDIDLSLSIESDGTIAGIRFSVADGWWFSYGQHGGQSFGYVADWHGIDEVLSNFDHPQTFSAPYLSLVGDGAGLGWSHSISNSDKRLGFALMHGTPRFGQHSSGGKRGVGILLSLSLNHDQSRGTGLALQAGAVRETDGFLGARPQGAFGKAVAATTFAGINGSWSFGNNDRWQLLASAYLGHTRAQIDDTGLLRDASPIVSSAFSIGAGHHSLWQADDWFELRLSQPLRAESGNVKLRVPVGRTKYGEVVYKNRTVSLVPTNRAVHAEVTYRLPIASGVLTTSMAVEHHPQHNIRSIDSLLLLSFERRF